MKKITFFSLIVFTTIITNAQDKLLSSISQFNNNGIWENSFGANYEYDSNKNLTVETGLAFEAGSWKIDSKSTYSYNASNRVIQEIEQNRNTVTNELEDDYRNTYNYTNGKLASIFFQEWLNGSWFNEYLIVASYNGNNMPDVVYEYNWVSGQWIDDRRTTYTYNASNKVISDIEQKWVNNQWVNDRKALYTYNASNKLITVQGADWDVFNNNWKADTQNVYDYVLDANGNRTSSTESGYRSDYTYDTTKLISNFAHPFKDKTGVDYFTEDFPYVNKVLTQNNPFFNTLTNAFEDSSRTTYNYNSVITLSTDTFEKAIASIKVYPNPTQDYLNIKNTSDAEIEQLTVTDLSGKKVLQQNNASKIDVQNLTKGLYLLQVFSGETTYHTKFVKK